MSDDEGEGNDEDDGDGSDEDEEDYDKETGPSEELPVDGVKEDSIHKAIAKSPQPSPVCKHYYNL